MKRSIPFHIRVKKIKGNEHVLLALGFIQTHTNTHGVRWWVRWTQLQRTRSMFKSEITILVLNVMLPCREVSCCLGLHVSFTNQKLWKHTWKHSFTECNSSSAFFTSLRSLTSMYCMYDTHNKGQTDSKYKYLLKHKWFYVSVITATRPDSFSFPYSLTKLRYSSNLLSFPRLHFGTL